MSHFPKRKAVRFVAKGVQPMPRLFAALAVAAFAGFVMLVLLLTAGRTPPAPTLPAPITTPGCYFPCDAPVEHPRRDLR
ncbi:hypothetical protein [Nocardia sp. IFM 10818]